VLIDDDIEQKAQAAQIHTPYAKWVICDLCVMSGALRFERASNALRLAKLLAFEQDERGPCRRIGVTGALAIGDHG
jgi:hypothetical protein